MRVAIAVVNHNTAGALDACLGAIVASSAHPVVVVDNGSTDDSVARVQRDHPTVTVLERSNLGYGAGANVAMRWARQTWDAEVVVLLNADTRVSDGAIDRLVQRLEVAPGCGVVGPRLIGLDGQEQRSEHPEPSALRVFLQESGLHRVIGPQLRRRSRPAWLLGAALAIRTDAWAGVGGFDEAYGMYFEEVDLCRRLLDAGWTLGVERDARVVHHGGASTEQARWTLRRRYFTSAARYHRRHRGRRSLAALQVAVAAVMVARLARDGVRLVAGRADAAAACRTWLQVLVDDVRGWPERPWP